MKIIKNLQSVLLSVMIFFSFASAQALAYSDVNSSHKYYEEITFLESNNLLPTESKLFEPDKNITAPEFYEMLLTFAQTEIVDEKDVKLPYTDFGNDNKYAKFIQTAINHKILNPPILNPKLLPNAPLRKRSVLIKLFDSLGVGVNKLFNKSTFPFKDMDPNSLNAPYFSTAYDLGIRESSSSTAKASRTMTKADIANMLYKIHQFKSGNNISIKIEPTSSKNEINNPTFDVFVKVWNTIKDKYYYRDEIDETQMIYNAIEGVIDTLKDPYTTFSNPKELSVANSLEQEYEGVGMSVEMINGKVTVVAPFKNSPAEEAGVKPNDIITKINGKSVDGLSITSVVEMIKGPMGTTVTLAIKRGTQNIEIKITRGHIFHETVTLDFLDKSSGKIAYINLISFGDETFFEFLQIAQEIHDRQTSDKNILGIIIDLRNNPGGYLDSTIEISGFFFREEKTIVVLEDNKGKKTGYRSEYYGSKNEYEYGAGLLTDYKVVILVNEGSASASEIMAGALQDYKKATVIGEKTFGKGTVQELLFYNDNSVFKITVSKWLTPKGREINKTGLVPDKTVKNTSPNTDTQLNEAKKEF